MRQNLAWCARSSPMLQFLDPYGYAGPRLYPGSVRDFRGRRSSAGSGRHRWRALSFITTQRTQEIGIRMALGANRSDVLWLVLRQAFLLGLIGVAVGLPLAFAAGRFARGELVNTSQYDPLALITAVCVLPLLSIAATYLLARRAAATTPVTALRSN